MQEYSRRATLGLMGGAGLVALGACAGAAGAGAADAQFAAVGAEALDQWARLSPVAATQLGDHRFDAELDDMSAAGRAARNAFRESVLARIAALDQGALSPAAQVDAAMLAGRMRFELWSERDSESWAWDPLMYSQDAGSALYGLMARDFAPLPERMLAATARMEKLPGLYAQIRADLEPARVPKVHAETWARQNPGIVSIVDDMILAHAEELGPADRARLTGAAEALKEAVGANQAWIEGTLVPAAAGDFRLGAEAYDAKLALALASPMSRADIRARAEARREAIYAEMAEIAGTVVSPPANERWTAQRLIRAALDRAAAQRPARADVVAACERTLAQATQFVADNNLVTLPDAPVNIILMPKFQQGVAVAYCDSPGPLDRDQPTFYAVSPIPDDWTEAQTTSFLREYNKYMIHELSVHEAMPGHYLQLWHSNKYPSRTRAAFYSGSFVEGWACYAEDMMIDEGYQDGDPLARLTNLKMELRTVTNALLDQAVHVDGASREDAMAMMTEGAFQEEREAAGKWIRASVTSAQLPTYFVGLTEHWALRREAEQRWGESFSLKRYHDTALSFGSPHVRHVRALMFGEPVQA